MGETPIRLGGMALQNGVLVHGPTAWACAVRDDDGVLHVKSARKPSFAPAARQRLPVLRGPLALAEAFALLPTVRRALPQARFPFERPSVLAAILGDGGRGARPPPLRGSLRERASSPPRASHSFQLRWPCEVPTSRPTTGPSTSRSVPTRTGARRRPRSTPGAARS